MQVLHAVAPGASENVPAGQGMPMTSPPGQYRPGPHSNVGTDVPSGQINPAIHDALGAVSPG